MDELFRFFRTATGELPTSLSFSFASPTVVAAFDQSFESLRWSAHATESGLKLSASQFEPLVDHAVVQRSQTGGTILYKLEFAFLLRWITMWGLFLVVPGTLLLITGWGPLSVRFLVIGGGPMCLLVAFANRAWYQLMVRTRVARALASAST